MDALTATVGITLAELPAQLERYLKQWRKRRYIERYPWVDQIAEIRDRRQAQDLDEQLVQRLAEGRTEHAWLAVPVPLDWSQVGGFRFSKSERAEIHDDVHLRAFLDILPDPTRLTPNVLRRRSVYCLGPDGRHAYERWSVHECLYAEVRQQNDLFLLTGGRWYQVAQRFVQRVDREIRCLRATDHPLPEYRHGSEEAYNRAVSKNDRAIVLMDRKNIRYGGGSSQIEFCDLFVAKKRLMLHVKRYGGSNVLSHLFSQGVVSATLLLQDQGFRKEVRRRLGSSYRERVPEKRPRAEDYEVGFVVISKAPGDLVLPFFSKVSLRNAVRTLNGLGYRVTLTKVDVNEGETP